MAFVPDDAERIHSANCSQVAVIAKTSVRNADYVS